MQRWETMEAALRSAASLAVVLVLGLTGCSGGGRGQVARGPGRGECSAPQNAATCEQNARCTWLTRGCDSTAARFTTGCYPRAYVGCEERGCPAPLTCQAVSINPCRPDEHGYACEACGAPETVCLPRSFPFSAAPGVTPGLATREVLACD